MSSTNNKRYDIPVYGLVSISAYIAVLEYQYTYDEEPERMNDYLVKSVRLCKTRDPSKHEYACLEVHGPGGPYNVGLERLRGWLVRKEDVRRNGDAAQSTENNQLVRALRACSLAHLGGGSFARRHCHLLPPLLTSSMGHTSQAI
ncbi:hypothetical protein M413DRAFT_149149 [Hebeloma cylindrosporum]|uniref:Uncharacterized protein n=1 Tax=Hebeloma cylindrosporum TaxID=76867 RepID=A0A0C3CB66_HEBCY|nr:hypothetical protein M413DRAFT_149149 [Hebeloma cylindrosporum h7]